MCVCAFAHFSEVTENEHTFNTLGVLKLLSGFKLSKQSVLKV